MTAPSPPAERETPAGLEAMRAARAAIQYAHVYDGDLARAFEASMRPIASELARLTALVSSSEAERYKQCGVLLERALAAEADNTRLRADLARKEEEIARLRAAIYRFVNLQGSLIPRRVFTAARAALTNPEQTDV